MNISDEDIVRAWNTYYMILQGHHTTTRKKVSRLKATSIDTILDLMQKMLAHLSRMCQDVTPTTHLGGIDGVVLDLQCNRPKQEVRGVAQQLGKIMMTLVSSNTC